MRKLSTPRHLSPPGASRAPATPWSPYLSVRPASLTTCTLSQLAIPENSPTICNQCDAPVEYRALPFAANSDHLEAEMHSRTRFSITLMALSLGLATLTHAATSVPAGTAITVTIDQSISSKNAKAGEGVVATVAQDVTANGRVVIPKGSHAKLVVSSAQASGRLSTPAKLWLRLKSVEVHGKTYVIATSSTGRTMGGKGKRDA